MSDHRDQYFDLAATEQNAFQRAEEVRGWMRASGWAAPRAGLFDWLEYTDLAGEPVAADAIGPRAIEQFERRAPDALYDPETTVSVVPGWTLYYTGEGFDGIRCPQCGESSEAAFDLVGQWDETRQAPVSVCEHCGWSGRLTDWNLRDAVAFAWVGIVADLPNCEEILLPELQSSLGGKWRWIHNHI